MSPLSKCAVLGAALCSSAAATAAAIEFHTRGQFPLGPVGRLLILIAFGSIIVLAMCLLRDSIIRELRAQRAIRRLWFFGIRPATCTPIVYTTNTAGSDGASMLRPNFGSPGNLGLPEDRANRHA